MYTKNCLECGDEFQSRTEGYCSIECEIIWRDQRLQKRKGASATVKESEKSMQQTQSTEKTEKITTPNVIEEKSLTSTTKETVSVSKTEQKQIENSNISMSLSDGLKKDILDSMNTLDKLSKNLLGSLESLTSPNEGTVKYVGPDKMSQANECSKQLVSCIRAKIELGRLGKDFIQMEKNGT